MNSKNLRSWLLSGAFFASIPAYGQTTITSADMFNETGLWYTAYANDYQPSDPSSSFPVANVMGSKGASQFWDFTTGPTNKMIRYDYLDPVAVPEAVDFPNAKIVERKSVNDTNEIGFLMFEQVQGLGRRVYGFYDAAFSPDTPSNVFNTPIVDFPDQIDYGDTWTTSTSFTTSIAVGIPPELGDLSDGETIESIPAQLTFSSTFTVDAWGTVDLPKLSFGDALRVNEEQTISVAVDLEGQGQYEHIEDDYTRNYYWLQPGHGIVAQLNSVQSTSAPPEKFDRATAFLRMFKTNKKAVAGCTDPIPVNDLKLSINSDGKVLLKWTKPQCAKQFRVEYTSNPTGAWNQLGDVTANGFMLDETAKQDSARFYRVISLR
jgi:hypothetical protein